MIDWSEINKKQKILLNEGIYEYFRYIKIEIHYVKDLALKVDNNHTIYSKAFDKIMAQKESVFKQNISIWGLTLVDMDNKAQLLTNKNLSFSKKLPRDTKKINEIRHTYGFYLNSLISEFERIRELNAKRYQKYINKFSKNLIESLNDIQVYLSDRIAYYDDIKEEGNNNEEQVEENKQQQNNNEGEIRGGNEDAN